MVELFFSDLSPCIIHSHRSSDFPANEQDIIFSQSIRVVVLWIRFVRLSYSNIAYDDFSAECAPNSVCYV